MTVLFGHPTGNPNSHHAALAHFEAGWLEAFCVSWMPTPIELALLSLVPGLRANVARLRRRDFAPLRRAPKVEGRFGEWKRMAARMLDPASGGSLAYDANEWLMRTMRQECARSGVTAVHSFEDCSLLQFEEAGRRGQARIYDLPIGYYPAWQRVREGLAAKYTDWLPTVAADDRARLERKRQEMESADLVIVASHFARRTVEAFANKRAEVAPYGVDGTFWRPSERPRPDGPMRFLYAGQCSLRKGTPLLLEAWGHARLVDATLDLVGDWQLSAASLRRLPAGVKHHGPASPEGLRCSYQSSDVFVFPSNFEGYGLVIDEAMACGLPVIATRASAGPELIDDSTGRLADADDLDAWIELLRWACMNRGALDAMRRAARSSAERRTWKAYRERVRSVTAGYVAR